MIKKNIFLKRSYKRKQEQHRCANKIMESWQRIADNWIKGWSGKKKKTNQINEK